MSDQVIIFDTTLRDGEQALSASLTVKEKLQIALALERLGVDVMEVGFPVSSPGDFESVQTIAKTIKNSICAGLSRAVKADIEACGNALKVAEQFRIHTFISTSSIHVENKLKRTFDDVLDMAVGAVKYARNFTDDVEFSCEDAGRTPIDNLCRMVEATIAAGAKTINIPDTVGYTIPSEFGGIIKTLYERVPNIDQAVISVHCHNDLGMSVANSISAIEAGARQVECTINGIGERAGNASLEEIAMILNLRKDILGVTSNINTTEIYRTSQLVSNLCNMVVQPNKAIVGSNAFSHSSGIHQDGMLKAKNTYEIMTAASIGQPEKSLNMTSRSGRHVIKHRMAELGYQDNEFDLDQLYDSFLALADKKGQVFDYDLEALLFFNQQKEDNDFYTLAYLSAHAGSGMMSTASIKLLVDNKEFIEAATGNGPVEAAFNAINRITNVNIEMIDYSLKAKGEGENALGQVDIIAVYNGQNFHGMGLATDVVHASVGAMLHVLNLVHRADLVANKKQAFKQQIAGV